MRLNCKFADQVKQILKMVWSSKHKPMENSKFTLGRKEDSINSEYHKLADLGRTDDPLGTLQKTAFRSCRPMVNA